MSLAKDLEIYKAADQLLALALQVQAQVPRAYRVAVGQRISNECADILLTVARANAAQGASREAHIAQLLERLEAATVLLRASHGLKIISHKVWATSIELTDSIGRQAGGWLKSARKVSAALIGSLHFARHDDFGYTPAVTSKKGVIGIGVPKQLCDESRSHPADSAAFSLVPPVLAARMGGRKARRFPQGLPGTPTCSSRRPQLALGATVLANRSTWRPIMADVIPLPTAAATPVQQTRGAGRYPKSVGSFKQAHFERYLRETEAKEAREKIEAARELVSAASQIYSTAQYKLALAIQESRAGAS